MKVKIIECPRDAMQGLQAFVPTDKKTAYIQTLLKVGFDTIDFGSFVSPKYIPQMKDTKEVIKKINTSETQTSLLAIVANLRGAQDAVFYDKIDCIGYPFSISETFQMRNTNTSLEDSFDLVEVIKDLCEEEGKKLVLYLSMAFGNPYGDLWDLAIIEHWVDRFVAMGIETISLSDTVGIAKPKVIADSFGTLANHHPKLELGAHLHSRADGWEEKLSAALENGCLRFDGAIKGYGGCPFADDELVGNMDTENIISFFEKKGVDLEYDMEAFAEAREMAMEIFPDHEVQL